MNTKVDQYLVDGCGRCNLAATPKCKVRRWPEELKELRRIVLECGLTEEVKWGVPCYTYGNHNVLIVSAFKEYCSISFFKGSLLSDPHGILYQPSENSQAARLIRITAANDARELEPIIKQYILEAIELEKAGRKVDFKAKTELSLPIELLNKFDELPDLKKAFFALTPGRQRGYVLHFTGAKQTKTRESRIEKCIPSILSGKGFHD